MKVSFKLWNPSGPASRKRENTEQSYRMHVLHEKTVLWNWVCLWVSDEVKSIGRSADIEQKQKASPCRMILFAISFLCRLKQCEKVSWRKVSALNTYDSDTSNVKYTEVTDGGSELVHRQLDMSGADTEMSFKHGKWWLGHEGRRWWQLHAEMLVTQSYHPNSDLPAIRQCMRRQIPDSSLPVEISSLHYNLQSLKSTHDVPKLKGTFLVLW